jgi:predicted DNA-binding transcriptional regulator YafY
MRRADRLFMIVERLRPGRLVTAAGLAEALEVSERTIYRDIAHLIGAALPIEGAAGMGYLMRPGYDLPPLMFDADEIVALIAGARMVSTFGGTGMARGTDRSLDKIAAILPPPLRARAEAVAIRSITARPLDPATRAAIDLLEHASEARLRLHIDYRDEAGAQTARIVRPLGLWFWGTVWTLVAWCELRQGFRMFRVDRITATEVLERFTPEAGQRIEDFYAAELDRRCD